MPSHLEAVKSRPKNRLPQPPSVLYAYCRLRKVELLIQVLFPTAGPLFSPLFGTPQGERMINQQSKLIYLKRGDIFNV